MKNIKREIKRKLYQQIREYLKLCLTHKLGKVDIVSENEVDVIFSEPEIS